MRAQIKTVNWQGPLEEKGVKQTGVKQRLAVQVYNLIYFRIFFNFIPVFLFFFVYFQNVLRREGGTF
jgi:hypothetical protein